MSVDIWALSQPFSDCSRQLDGTIVVGIEKDDHRTIAPRLPTHELYSPHELILLYHLTTTKAKWPWDFQLPVVTQLTRHAPNKCGGSENVSMPLHDKTDIHASADPNKSNCVAPGTKFMSG